MMLEQPCIFQGVVAFLAALYFLRRGDRKRMIICAAFCLASVIAFLIMYLAPGTTSRMGGYASIPLLSRLGRMLAVAVVFGGVTVLKFFVKPIVWVLLLFLPSIHAWLRENRAGLRLKAWQIFLITILIAPLTHGISGWAGGEGLPLRAESLTIWMMGFTWTLLWIFCYDASGWTARLKTKKFFSMRWALLIIALVLNFNCVTAIKELLNGSAARYAAECDVRDARAEAASQRGDRDVTVALLTEHPALLLYSDLRPWASYWVNVSFAKFHGVKSVIALPGAMLNDEVAIARWKSGDVSDLQRVTNGDGVNVDGNIALVLGELYDPAFGGDNNVAKDPVKAVEWYRKAAEAGNVQACRRLTRLAMFESDTGKFERYARAGYWFMRSVLPLIRP